MNIPKPQIIPAGIWEAPIEPKEEVEHQPPKKKGFWVRYREYRGMVDEYTEQENWESLKNADKRSWDDHHLDHKISVMFGFKNDLPPCFIGGIHNLQILPRELNCKKGHKNSFV